MLLFILLIGLFRSVIINSLCYKKLCEYRVVGGERAEGGTSAQEKVLEEVQGGA
jgi:hypothetical protein